MSEPNYKQSTNAFLSQVLRQVQEAVTRANDARLKQEIRREFSAKARSLLEQNMITKGDLSGFERFLDEEELRRTPTPVVESGDYNSRCPPERPLGDHNSRCPPESPPHSQPEYNPRCPPDQAPNSRC